MFIKTGDGKILNVEQTDEDETSRKKVADISEKNKKVEAVDNKTELQQETK